MKKIKLFDPSIDEKEQIALTKILKSHFWASGAGVGNVKKFEDEFKEYVNAKECVAVNNGTSALYLAMSLANIKNKEVILPSLTFVSTAHSIIKNGGIPIFVDVDPETLCIDPKKIINAITKKTGAILPVHFAGMSCNIKEIKKICIDNQIELVEDAAHAAGASYGQRKIGSHGSMVCFSFHPIKNLAMPTGGLIALNNKKYKKYKKILMAKRWCGITNRNGINYDIKDFGENYYMNEFSAGIGRIQLKKLDTMNNKRRKIAKIYENEILLKKIPYSEECSYHLYWILVKNRTKFMKNLKNVGIETGNHYRPIHTTSFYRNKLKLNITEKIGKNIVTIPIHPNLTEYEIDRIVNTINKYS